MNDAALHFTTVLMASLAILNCSSYDYELFNQRDELVFSMRCIFMIASRE